MPFYRMNGQVVHMNLGGKLRRNPPAPCCTPVDIDGKQVRCMAISSYLCDHENSDGKTCDAPLCPDHAHQVGPNRHLCQHHMAKRAETQPELFGPENAGAAP